MFGIAAPSECDRERDGDARGIVKTDFFETAADFRRDPLTIEVLGIHRDVHDRYVARGEHVRIGKVNGLAADLHSKLRGADDGRTDALAGIDQRQAAARSEE